MLKALVISLIIWVVVTFFVRVYGKSMNAAERIEYELFQKTPKRVTNVVIVWLLSSAECVICLIVFIIKL